MKFLFIFLLIISAHAVDIKTISIRDINEQSSPAQSLEKAYRATYEVLLFLSEKEYKDVVRWFADDSVRVQVLPYDKRNKTCVLEVGLTMSYRSEKEAKSGFEQLIPTVRRGVEECLKPQKRKY